MGNKEGKVGNDYAPTRNSVERQASADHLSEAVSTGKDPIPKEPPSWAENLPSPKDGGSGSKWASLGVATQQIRYLLGCFDEERVYLIKYVRQSIRKRKKARKGSIGK